MSSRRVWLSIAALAALVLGGTERSEPVVRDAKGSGVTRGELVAASLPGRKRLDYFLFAPVAISRDAPLLVAIHGISRNAREQAEHFAPLAARHGFSVVAPHFDEEDYDDYQRLGRRGRGPRADAALERLIETLGRRGFSFGDLFLFGFSGGGQFVHRYVMAHPERVRAGIVAGAGWYTFPDPSRDYPYGIRLDAELPGVRLRPRSFLRVPMLAVVGDEDRERDDGLRRSSSLDRQQGRNRVERARRWVHAMRAAATEREMDPRVELVLLEGAGHSFEQSMEAGLGELVVDYVARWRRPLGSLAGAAPRTPEPKPPRSRWCVADGH